MTFRSLLELGLSEFIDKNSEPECLWLFVHIPKTAGSSLSKEISRRRKPYRNIHVDYMMQDIPHDRQMQHAVDKFIDDARKTKFRSASGHITIEHAREIRAAIPGTKFVSFLRDPVARLVSDFRYARTPRHPPYQRFIAQFPTLDSYIRSPESQNKMSRHLGGSDPNTVFAEFDFIGALELYPLSFSIFFQLMGEDAAPRLHERKTEPTADNDVDLTPELAAQITECNQEDTRIFLATRDALRARRAEWRALRHGK